MKTQRIALAAGALAAILAFAGCSASAGSSGSDGSSGTSGSSSTSASAGNTLKTASTDLGTVVVDENGMTLYYYDKDTKGSGKSSCTGSCLTDWPAVTTTKDTPKLDGVTGEVGTIPGPGDTKQVTLDGMPLYTYAGDAAAGDVKGQGVGGIWWVVDPSGKKITKAPASGSGY